MANRTRRGKSARSHSYLAHLACLLCPFSRRPDFGGNGFRASGAVDFAELIQVKASRKFQLLRVIVTILRGYRRRAFLRDGAAVTNFATRFQLARATTVVHLSANRVSRALFTSISKALRCASRIAQTFFTNNVLDKHPNGSQLLT